LQYVLIIIQNKRKSFVAGFQSGILRHNMAT